MRPRLPALLTCLLLVGAGCLAGPGTGDEPAASPTAVASVTPTASPTASDETPATTPTSTAASSTQSETGYGTDCPYHLHANVASESQLERFDRRVAYANLSEPRQEEFRRAVSEGVIELGNTLPEPWGEVELVEYEGELYAVVPLVC